METIWPTVFVGMQLVAAIIDGKYYISERQMTWTDALSVCKLAKPNITYEANGESIQIGALKVEQNTWVGYVVQFVVLDYIGCYHGEHISSQAVRTFQTQVKVDVCFSACDSSYFAIGNDHSCICINEMENLPSASSISWSLCDKRCDNLACGSRDSKYMSVYSRDADSPDTHPNETNPSCFAYDKNMSLEYKRCDNNNDGFICPTIGEENGPCAVVTGEKKWFDSIRKYPEHCENKTGNCSTFVGQSGNTFWSSSVGVWVILTNQTLSMDRPEYVSYVDSSGQLYLTPDLSRNYFALCENTSIYTTQSSTSTASDTTDGVLVGSTPSSGHDISTTLSISATPTVMTYTETTANNNGLYVGLPVGMVLFLTIIVLLVFFRRRIYRLITKAQKNGDTGFNNVIYDDSIEPQTNRDVASTLLSTPPEQPNYYRTVLDPVQTVVTTKQLNKQFTNGADDEAPRDIPQQNNFYDVADCPSQPIDQHIYDHTDINKGHNNTTTLTENYNSFPPVDDDNTYDVHNSGQRSQNHKDRSHNIYNTPCNLMSDGIIYDHTGGANARGVADENMYGHVSSDVTDNDGEDTYNHI